MLSHEQKTSHSSSGVELRNTVSHFRTRQSDISFDCSQQRSSIGTRKLADTALSRAPDNSENSDTEIVQCAVLACG